MRYPYITDMHQISVHTTLNILPTSSFVFNKTLAATHIPTTFEEASQREGLIVMQEGMQALVQNDSLTLNSLPAKKKSV